MKNKYCQVMDKIEVTEEMKDRILRNAETGKKITGKKMIRIIAPIAACLLLVLGISLHSVLKTNRDSAVQIANPITEAQSLQELSRLVGFDAVEIEHLPFDTESVSYTACNGEMAEIRYIGKAATWTLRQAEGSEDISGNYDSYSFEDQVVIGGASVLLRGQSPDCIFSAVWCSGNYTFSLSFSSPVSQDLCRQVISSLNLKSPK